MIELNKQYRYKNKTVVPVVIQSGNIICFDSKGATIFVKKESDLTKIEEENTIVEPTYIKKEEVKVETKIAEPAEQTTEETKIEEVKAVEPEVEKPVVEEPKTDGYDDFYEVKIPSVAKAKKKRVNIIEKNDYI